MTNKQMGEDKLGTLNDRLRDVIQKFQELKQCGMDEEILIAFIHDRTKLSKGSIKMFLTSMDEFYIEREQKAHDFQSWDECISI